ncbi:BTB/POZ domain-containing protein 6 [Aphelenchoides avenae]|nr:BTB/POZ domain-containing protein 6 [Aphelenchus avenae]
MGNENSVFPHNFDDFSDCSSDDLDAEVHTPGLQRLKLCKKLFESRDQTGDVVFVIGSAGKASQRISAHKAILAASSDVFAAQFYGAFGSPPEVDLTDDADIQPEGFTDFLRCVYLGDFDDCIDLDNVVPLLSLSKKYLLEALTKECETFLDHFIDETNLFELLDDLGKHEEVDKVFWSFVDSETYAVLFSDGFQSLGVEDMAAIIGRDSLGIRESDVFEAVIEWATVGLEKVGKEVNRESVREFVGDAFYLIRFKQMHKDEKALFSQFPASVLARFESSPRTGDVPAYVPPKRITTMPATPRSIVKKRGTYARLEPERTVYLGNLPSATTAEDLETLLMEHFDDSGASVSDFKLFPDRRFAFIELASRQLAEEAVDALDNLRYSGQKLRCNFHRDRQ